MAMLSALLKGPAPMPCQAHLSPEVSAVLEAIRTLPLETIAAVSKNDLKTAASDAIARRHDIAWIGISPQSVAFTPAGFMAIADMRIEGEEKKRTIVVTGDMEGRIVAVTDVTVEIEP